MCAQEEDEGRKRDDLYKDINKRMSYDCFWGEVSFIISETKSWITILASLASAIAVAYRNQNANPIVVAGVAAVPAAAGLIDQNFGFARRARWHWMQEQELRKLAHSLIYEGAKVDDVSKKYSELRIEMEKKFPIMGVQFRRRPKAADDSELEDI